MPSLTITPNPTDGKLNINNTEYTLVKLEVVDAMGNVLMSVANPSNLLDITNMSNGTYFIRLYTDKTFTTRKVMKN
jgi:hypothetical protein